MDRAQQTQVVKKLFAHMAAGTTDLAPGEMYQEVSVYTDPAFAARERTEFFRRPPLVVCHSNEVKAANDFLTADLAGVPVLLVRQADGALKAFTNVCRHRGSKLETAERGNRKLFVCPFHAWSYDCAGSLRAVPFAGGFDQMDRATRGLVELPVQERHGLVWVVPVAAGAGNGTKAKRGKPIDVAAYIGKDFEAELAAWKLQDYVFERVQHFEVDINWKLLIDGFLEDYHLTVLHKSTIGPYFAANLHTFASFGRNGRLIAARANLTKLKDAAPDQVDMLRCAAVVYSLFPNAVLVWQADHFELWTIFPDPTTPGRSRVSARLLAPSTETARTQKALWDKNWKILMDTVEKEDWIASKDIQNGIAGGGQTHFVFGRNEPALQHFHRQIARGMAAG